MSLAYPRPPRRFLLVLDAALVGWIVAWIVLGVSVGREMRGLRDLSDTVVLAGEAIEETGQLLGRLGSVPFLGGGIGGLAERIEETGRSAQESARGSSDNVGNLSILLGLSIALIPTVPLAAIYLPARIAWRRESLAVAKALRRSPPDPFVERFLAHRAVQALPYERLRAVSEDPWRDLAEGRYSALADAELDRLGVTRR